MVIAKFTVVAPTNEEKDQGYNLALTPIYDDRIEEDRRFASSAPQGRLVMKVENDVALQELALGAQFILTFTPAHQWSEADQRVG